ncbi:lysozyme inhibitor LprI family protein [Marivita sp.]|uniref:lysozyme inhibitor LprI family protein n=1 Tax=Marivita sp. TaxID=2003365 RepID=UPI0025B93285|nr:lysozyme inhibitor LprI family protein [Marivita sp.]
MKRVLMIAAMLCAPQVSEAQGLTIDPQIVRDCFATTETGAFFPACLGQASGQCQDLPGGSTTIGIAECIAAETAEWDTILNEEYQATQKVNESADTDGLSQVMDRSDALRDAQRAWIAFRDADCGARYAMWQNGTIRTIVAANCHLTMTAQRAISLRDMRGE